MAQTLKEGGRELRLKALEAVKDRIHTLYGDESEVMHPEVNGDALVRMAEKNRRYMKLEPGREMALLFRTSSLEIDPLEWLENNLMKLIK